VEKNTPIPQGGGQGGKGGGRVNETLKEHLVVLRFLFVLFCRSWVGVPLLGNEQFYGPELKEGERGGFGGGGKW